MRILTDHVVHGDQASQLQIRVIDKPGSGGANHRYDILGFDTKRNSAETGEDGYMTSYSRLPIIFQNGPIKEVGLNGITHEALLVILIDRLLAFQLGGYACEENARALDNLQEALAWLQKRTLKRIQRGVEGTTTK
jgi:hypothetical protein